jgi:N-acetylglucosamine kinase-like BadF-type ATPase
VAVDGGGSKTDVVAVTMAGDVLASARGAGSNPQTVGLAAAVATIGALIEGVLARSQGRSLDRVGIYLSGLDFDREVEEFRAAIRSAGWYDRCAAGPPIVDNDLFAVLRAGTSAPDAVAVVCGTGINCLGVRSDGATIRYPALGTVSGDWGGGWHLGEQAMWWAARALDGRGPATDLTARIPQAFGARNLPDVIEALHFGTIDEVRLAALSPVVFDAATAGDAVACSLVDRQADEIVDFAASALRRLDLLDRDVPFVLGGGIVRAQHPRLMSGVRRRVAERIPRADITVVAVPPVLGAALLVLDSVVVRCEQVRMPSPSASDWSPSVFAGAPTITTR